MTTVFGRAKVLIADWGPSPWARNLEQSLLPLPVDLHWSSTDVEAIGLVSGMEMHLAVVDGALPGGGLNLVRRVRKMGLIVPTLLVCNQPDQRLLQDALALDIYSVVTPDTRDLLTPLVFKVFRQVYQFDLSPADTAN
jgi:hypothetical protein